MGQRHQIFVKIANPLHHFSNPSKVEIANLKKEFGTGEFAILGYHNQWLYGRSALENCLRLLFFAKQFSRESKVSSKVFDGYNSPICPNGIKSNFTNVKDLTTAIGIVMNFQAVKSDWLEAGFNSSRYEGAELNHDFTIGDNNDGIHIVDMVERKYCFMNISRYKSSDNSLCHSASDLPYLVPVDAKAYVAAYYGETLETCNPYYFERAEKELKDYTGGDKEAKIAEAKAKIINDNIKTNGKIVKKFKGFELLTIDEIKAMFPKMLQLVDLLH
jgi:hypothetical protein